MNIAPCLPVLLSTAILFSALTLQAALPPETDVSHEGWFAELPPALAEAGKLKKDLLIDFGGSDWCAPCRMLKAEVFMKKSFTEKASENFVLVDIDTLARGLSPERQSRYVELQRRYRVEAFPSVFLTTPEGEPYAWTTYVPNKPGLKSNSEDRFWGQIEPLISRGRAFRDGMAKAKNLSGTAKANAMIDGLSKIRGDFLLRYYPEKVAELRALDPSDGRGFIAYLDSLAAYLDLEGKIGGGYDLNKQVNVADVDELIAKHGLKGELLQQALAMKATLLIIAGDLKGAFKCIGDIADAQASRGRYDCGDYLPLTAAGAAQLKKRAIEATSQDAVAQYLALHRIFEQKEFPNRYEICCHSTQGNAFSPCFPLRFPIGDGYGKAILDATASLQGKERARALGNALEDTHFLRNGVIEEIVHKTIPELCAPEKGSAFLPERYRGW